MSVTTVSNPSTSTAMEDASPERIAELASGLAGTVETSITEIKGVNVKAQLLSFNARIEAARAGGTTGAAFGIVAEAMSDLSLRTSEIATQMARDAKSAIVDLERVNRLLTTHARGLRLSDLALVNIDLVDRNLYERTCDVRWWATDASLVDALTTQAPAAAQHASDRMGVILSSYTVYYDLVLCDLSGRVIANGRPSKNPSLGTVHKEAEWFRSAMQTHSGDEFGFETVHPSPLVGGERALVYSCCVRELGCANGKPIGVLGIVFNWDALAQTILENVPLAPAEITRSRAFLTNDHGRLLADSWGRQLHDTFDIPESRALFLEPKNFCIADYQGRTCCIGHARSPGFETYATGWHSVIVYSLDGDLARA